MVENVFITKITNLFKNNQASHVLNIKIKNYTFLKKLRENIENYNVNDEDYLYINFKFCYYDPDLNTVYFYTKLPTLNDEVIKSFIRKKLEMLKSTNEEKSFTFSIFKYQEEITV